LQFAELLQASALKLQLKHVTVYDPTVEAPVYCSIRRFCISGPDGDAAIEADRAARSTRGPEHSKSEDGSYTI